MNIFSEHWHKRIFVHSSEFQTKNDSSDEIGEPFL
jgi:hypothetical protein